jgi:hypothetical protein
MKRLVLAGILAIATVMLAPPSQARTVVAFGVGVGCCGYYPAYPAYPAYYGYPAYYYAPPPAVVYAPAPQPVVYAPPPALLANQTSPTFMNASGQECRRYQSAIGGAPVGGTACLQPDGVWRSVGG